MLRNGLKFSNLILLLQLYNLSAHGRDVEYKSVYNGFQSMMVFSQIQPLKHAYFGFQKEQYFGNQTLYLNNGGNLSTDYNTITVLHAGIDTSLNTHIAIRAGFYNALNFGISTSFDLQHDYYRWSSGKLSAGIMYSAIFGLIYPQLGIQASVSQQVLDKNRYQVSTYSSLQLRNQQKYFDSIVQSNSNDWYTPYYANASVNTLTPVIGADLQHNTIGLKIYLGYEHILDQQEMFKSQGVRSYHLDDSFFVGAMYEFRMDEVSNGGNFPTLW